jgi:hypothetical protein
MRVFIDLFCGLGGASSAFANDKNWKVIQIDNNPELLDHVRGMWLLDMMDPMNVYHVIKCHLHEQDVKELVIWASPPCLNFSDGDPDRDTKEQDLTLLHNTCRLIDWLDDEFNLTSYFIENVRGAIREFEPVLGHYRQRIGPFFLWGRFVPIACLNSETHRHKKPFNQTNSRTHLRSNIHAKIPYALSESVKMSLEQQLSLLRWVE